MTLYVLILALIWGVFWAVCLEYVPLGRWLAAKRTYITVIIGVGGDLALVAMVVDWQTWCWVAAIIGLSSVGVIARSLGNEMHEWVELMEHHRADRQGRQ